MPELLPVNILIADRTYRLKVASTDEEVLRKTVKIINDKIIEYKTQLAGKDMQDYVSMALLWFATSQTKSSENILTDKETTNNLNMLEAILDRALEEK